jgi:transposase
MQILALDLGKSKTVACGFDGQTGQATYQTIRTTARDVHDLIVAWQPQRVVFEIGPQAGWVYDVVSALDVEIEVANPNHEAWRWRNVKRKTDRLDALKLARLSAMGQLPTVHMPAPAVRQRRSLIGYRKTVVERITAIKNHIRSILTRQGISMPAGKSGWTDRSLAWLRNQACPVEQASLEELWRAELHQELALLAAHERVLAELEEKLNRMGAGDEGVRVLRTIPGVGPRLAEAFVAAIDDPGRFRTGRQVGSYLGLTPRQYQSGSSNRQGRISGQGNRLVRSLLVEVSWLGLRYNPWMRAIYERARRGSPARKKIAIVAVARRLAVLCWAMLRDQSDWRPAVANAAA